MVSLWLVRILDMVSMRQLLHVTPSVKAAGLSCLWEKARKEAPETSGISIFSGTESMPSSALLCSGAETLKEFGLCVTAVLVPASAFWQMIPVLDHRTLVGLRDWTLGCRRKQLLDEDIDSLYWSRCVLPPDLKETRNWFGYEMHFWLVHDGAVHRQDLVSRAVMFMALPWKD